MIQVNPYKLAWKTLQEEIQTKTGWGKNELQALMNRTLIDAYEKAYKAKYPD